MVPFRTILNAWWPMIELWDWLAGDNLWQNHAGTSAEGWKGVTEAILIDIHDIYNLMILS